MKPLHLILLFFLIFPDTDFRGFTFLRLGSEPDINYDVLLISTKRVHYKPQEINFKINCGLHYDFALHGFKIYVMHTRWF